MTTNDWAVLAAVIMPIALATTPWMFMVHAKLAVIAAKVSDLCETIKHANEQQLRLAGVLNQHAARLDAIEQQMSKSEARISKSETNQKLE